MKNLRILLLLIRTFGFRRLYFIIIFLKMVSGWFTSFTLFMDYLLYPDFAKKQPDRPIFLMGHPRSGTTFTHRFLIEHCPELRSLFLYEMLFPALSARRITRRYLPKFRKMNLDKLYDPAIHKTGFFKVETEDVALFLRYFDGLLSWMYFHLYARHRDDQDFERRLTKILSKEKFIRYLKKVHQRNVCRTDQRIFSKSFALLFCTNHIQKHFPGARIIVMLRDPASSVPSFMSLVTGVQNKMNRLNTQPQEIRERFYKGFYQTSLLYFKKQHEFIQQNKSNPDVMLVTHKELTGQFEETMQKITCFYGIETSGNLLKAIAEQAKLQQEFRSSHVYTMEQFGLNTEMLKRDFSFIYENYDL